jgi:3-oxoadipate enol-lactonase
MTEHFFEPCGIYYRTNNFQPTRQTLVFIHGLSGSSSAWIPYEELFTNSYNILSLDLRGHGKSAKPKAYSEYNIPHYTHDLEALFEYLGIAQCILVSHSFGSLVALEFLAQHQDRVRAAVFISPSYAVRNRGLARLVQSALRLTPVFSAIPFSGKPGHHIHYDRYRGTGDWNVRRMIADIRNTSLRVYLYTTKQTYTFNREALLGRITIPTLLIHGKRDSIFPVSNSLTMQKRIKHAKLLLLEDANHIIVLNKIPEVAKAIEDFIQSLP